ncbi:N-acetylmuramoyl-L-alanine amidase [Paenibacillus albicereus]|uniref:N-acetylmuramoyl-L-alanine amidase n=1 Tax=Paenibacillus albicereus TaxID=2726185 RepID=A0A6H2H062_9BACL|nr:N-acetylmuramoyl-L-alanine amidase [Paenibacillus albicereus]QJC53045.1 N-acetylmuramoyl-L-alanine amidase [Paenibacillus albicereus]
MNYRKDHIPTSTPCKRRPGVLLAPETITIHNTGNPGSSAANERAWLTNPANDRQASYHIVVDEREAVECIPLTEHAWHAGDGAGARSGNRTSIAVEVCESGDYAKTLTNAAELVADMLCERGWGVDRLRRHYDWSRKICPRLMYDEGKWTGWTAFKAAVQERLTPKAAAATDVVAKVVRLSDGKLLASGRIEDGKLVAPVADVLQALGVKVQWDNSTKKLYV